jgi:hypothetical protein
LLAAALHAGVGSAAFSALYLRLYTKGRQSLSLSMTLPASQTITALCAAIAAGSAVACLMVLLRFLRASQSQAESAARLTRESLRPILLCTAIETLDDERRHITLTNQSNGVALDVCWSDDESEPSEDHRVNGPSLVLGPHGELTLTFCAARTTRLIFVYQSVFHERARTEVLVIDDLYSNRYFPEPLSE